MKVEIDIDPAELVISQLKEYYELCKYSNQEDEIFRAIEVVLSHFLTHEEYIEWYKGVVKND